MPLIMQAHILVRPDNDANNLMKADGWGFEAPVGIVLATVILTPLQPGADPTLCVLGLVDPSKPKVFHPCFLIRGGIPCTPLLGRKPGALIGVAQMTPLPGSEVFVYQDLPWPTSRLDAHVGQA